MPDLLFLLFSSIYVILYKKLTTESGLAFSEASKEEQMITGFLCAACLILLLAKYPVKRFKWKRADLVLGKMHLPLVCILILLIMIHVVTTASVWNQRHAAVVISGMAMGALVFTTIGSWFICKKSNKKFLRFHRLGAVLIVIALFVHVGSYYIDFLSYQNRSKNTVVTGMGAAGLKDGIYLGEYSVGYINAGVSVEVREEKVIGILILWHENERGGSAEVIIDDVLNDQSTAVDAVSGATNSSKVLLKAIENALNNEPEK